MVEPGQPTQLLISRLKFVLVGQLKQFWVNEFTKGV
jgi:hypothetical protein